MPRPTMVPLRAMPTSRLSRTQALLPWTSVIQLPPALEPPARESTVSSWRKRFERVPPERQAPAAWWRLRWLLPVKAVVRNRTLPPTPLARRHASTALGSKSSSGLRWAHRLPCTPSPPDVAPAVSTPTALACRSVYWAEPWRDAPVAPGRRTLAPAPLWRAGAAAKPAFSWEAGPASRMCRCDRGWRPFRRNPLCRAWRRAVRGCAASAQPPTPVPTYPSRSSGPSLRQRSTYAAHAVSAAVWATSGQPRRLCRGCAAWCPVAAFRRRRCPAFRSSCSLRECSRPRSRCSVCVARVHAGERHA